MSERNENELNDKQQLTNEEIEKELGEFEVNDNERIEDDQIRDEIEEQDKEDETANETATSPALTAAPERNLSALIAPWVITAIAVVALVLVLVRNPSGGLNETVGTMDGATYKAADLYEEMSKQMGEEQQVAMLDSLMTLQLINLEADEAGVTVSDADIQAEIENIKKTNNIATDEDLSAALQQSGMTMESFKENITNNMKFRKIIEKQSPASEDDLKAYYEKNKENFATTPKQVRASHILLATKEEAEAVLAELKAGEDFATLAKAKSQDPGSKDNGGELPLFGRGEMNAGFEEAAFALAKGEMSGVVEAESGFHIIKVTDVKEAVIPSYEESKEKVKQTYYDEKLQTEGEAWMEKAKKDRNYKNLLVKEPEPTATASAPASPEAK